MRCAWMAALRVHILFFSLRGVLLLCMTLYFVFQKLGKVLLNMMFVIRGGQMGALKGLIFTLAVSLGLLLLSLLTMIVITLFFRKLVSF